MAGRASVETRIFGGFFGWGAVVVAATAPVSTTVIGLGERFDEQTPTHVERANAKFVEAVFGLLGERRRSDHAAQRLTIDFAPRRKPLCWT